MDKNPGKRFGGGRKFGGPGKFGGPKRFDRGVRDLPNTFKKFSRGPKKFGGPKPADGVKPEGRVGGGWRAPGVASPASATRKRGDFRPPHLRDGYQPREGYAPRPSYGDRPVSRFSRDERPARAFGREGYAPRPYQARGPRPSFRRDDRPGYAPSKAPAKTSWGVAAEWYDGAVEAEGSYQRELILPNLVRLIGAKGDEKIADIACGQGFFARELAKLGADVVGVDISPELIQKAGERAEGSARFSVAPAHETGLDAQSFDHALIVLALQNIRELAETLAEAARVLAKGGALHLVLNHPCFRVPKKSSWGYDEAADVQFRRLDAYLSDAAVRMEMHPGAAPEIATASFHRPLQAYFKTLEKAGLAVTRLEEWRSEKTSQPGRRAEAENVARREFPLFMYVRAEKR
jgi:ubiquinone/menaquinone biosynthesis C-methylase UbiE